MKENIQGKEYNSKEVEQANHSKYLIFLALAKRLIFTSRKRFLNNFLRFKRLCVFENLEQHIILNLNFNKDLPLQIIKLERLINKIIKLYPLKNIKTNKLNQIDHFVNSKQLISIVLIQILEKTLNYEITISLKTQKDSNVSLTINSYFNDNNFFKLKDVIDQYHYLLPALIIDNFSITIILIDNQFLGQKSRTAQISDFTYDMVSSNCSFTKESTQRGQLKKQLNKFKQAPHQDEVKSEGI